MKRTLLFQIIFVGFIHTSAFAQTHLKIIIMAGQSNMVGNGGNTLLPADLQGTQSNVKIYCNGTFDNSVLNQWLNVKPGMGSLVPNQSPSPAFGSEVSFAKGISGYYPNDHFAIIKCAYSGTDMATRWRSPSSGGTTGDLYSNLINTVNAALNNLGPGYTYEIAGICWMQGESDAMNNTYANEYQSNLTNFIKDVRSAFHVPNLPFVIAKIGTNMTQMPFNAIVRQAQSNVAAAGTAIGIFDTQSYATSDGIHYYSDGYVTLGYSFANALKPLLLVAPVAQTPYTGTAYPIPGIIEAENFDKGGEGVAYHDNESDNLGAQYRTAEGVDIQVCTEGGFDLGWTVAGEWQEYSVNVLATGTYKVAARVACGTQVPGSFHIEFNGVNSSGTINGLATGDWQTWTTVNDTFNLTAGTHIMRVYYEKPDVNVNNFTFTNLTTTGTGNGLAGNYFNGMNFETPVFSRKDDVINFNWNEGSPDASVNVDQFSARWTGQIQAKYTDTYTFYVNSDNGRRLWVNGQLIIDKWIPDYGIEYQGTIALKAGQKYDIKVEYFEKDGGANCKLEWSSPTQTREVVPKNQLYAANQAPTVSITAPTNNAVYIAPASVTITANANDADGTISKVEFYNGTTLLNSDATAPYSYSWTNVTAGTYAITAKAYDNVNAVTTSAAISIQVNAPANQLPTVNITAPANSAVYTSPASVTITANANDADGSISKVEFYNGTTLLNSDNAAPYTYNWTNVAAGTYSITAKAYDNVNAVTTSTTITVQVNAPANQLPTVSITAPTNNVVYTSPASVTITANANDADGSISKIEFYNGTTLLNSDNAAPYSYTWTNVTAGTYAITAKAYDNVNAVTTSTAITVQVNAPANQLPTVSITAPTNNVVYTSPASVTITANANDADGSISKVEFYNGSTLLNSDNAAPYNYTWTNIISGTYMITAKAYDNVSASTVSAAVTIQVNTPPNQVPTVRITAPSNNTVYSTLASVTIIADASDADGSVSKVEFYNGTTLLGADNVAPYSYIWSNVGVGTYMITAKVYDNVNASTISVEVEIEIEESIPTSLNNSTSNALSISAAPIPFQHTTRIQTPVADEIQNIIIYNAFGKQVERLENISTNEIAIGDTWVDGMYLVYITTTKGTATIKVLKGN